MKEGIMFPVYEVCGDIGLVDECPLCSLYLTVLIIIHWALELSQGHLHGGGSLRRGGVHVETCWMPLIEWGIWSENWWTQSGHGVHRIWEGFEAPWDSGPHFMGVTIPWASPSNVEGKGAEMGTSGRSR
jgi:hypothetical protein